MNDFIHEQLLRYEHGGVISDLLGYNERHTQTTNRPTNRRTSGLIGKLRLQKSHFSILNNSK